MKEKILKALKQADGHVSGEQLGRQLNISRTAVWKHIKELRGKGYQIDSSPRSGYTYIESPDLIVPEELVLDLETHKMGNRIVYRNEVISTQDVADKLALSGVEEGLVVIAEAQTKGRGRLERSWVSPHKGGIYFSLVLRPRLKPINVIQIPLVAAVALTMAIDKVTSIHPDIKWPNDIYIGSKKVAGILTEMNCEIDIVNYIVLGIGINVNTRVELLPEPARDIATSLVKECGRDISRMNLLRQFLIEFEKVYEEFLISGFSAIRGYWKQHNNTIGSQVLINDGSNDIAGMAIDIDEDGFLLVKTSEGDIQKIMSADITLKK